MKTERKSNEETVSGKVLNWILKVSVCYKKLHKFRRKSTSSWLMYHSPGELLLNWCSWENVALPTTTIYTVHNLETKYSSMHEQPQKFHASRLLKPCLDTHPSIAQIKL